ncbi:SDR family NAD(P)-dependent oxidoreductase [Mycobacterium stomatepiae]|uniref:SDR family NAD(P)-dependent oxidoreductase n=1 Tax=Mycobacterium stomatepiae TaxID=470076 RepID=UPI0013D1FE9B|nr:SDR family NAD(P)-dependent oxidoreductase [Mycobacterium stomatepiae]
MTLHPSPFRADILQGKVALVTGGATGLGLEIARVLGNHGARVAICSRKEPNLQAAVMALRQEGIGPSRASATSGAATRSRSSSRT